LVPAGSGCAVLVTSRTRLAALDDADPIRLEPLPGGAAATLFVEIAGLDPSRIDHRSDQNLGSIVASCGGLPLAVRIAAARQRGSGDPHDLVGLAGRLADSTRRLSELDDGERSARSALAASCSDLPSGRRELLALLALQPGPDVCGNSAAWLAGSGPGECDAQLRRLVDESLLSFSSGDRYYMHDLTRAFAVQALVPDVPVATRRRALRRWVTGYLASADAADRLLTPHRFRPPLEPHLAPTAQASFADTTAANAWFTEELPNLVAACRLAAAEGWAAACWQLAYVMRGYLFLSKSWDAWIDTHRIALDAARAAGHEWGEAITASNLGLALVERGHVHAAQEHYRRSLATFRLIGDAVGEAGVLGHQAWVAYCLGNYRSCYDLALAALAICEEQGVRRNAAITMRTLALAESELGRAEDAERRLRTALATFSELDLPLDAAMACNDLGQVRMGCDDPASAVNWYARALRLAESCASPYEQARAFEGLGAAATAQGRWRAADHFRSRALDRYEALNAPEARRLRATVERSRAPGGRTAPSADDPDERRGQLEQLQGQAGLDVEIVLPADGAVGEVLDLPHER
jgi:tetratricopeptide (TPR) repeat protein